MLASAFVLPSIVLPGLILVVVLAGASAGVLGPLVRALRIPLLLVVSILVVNALFYPGAQDRIAGLGPIGVTREGLTFGTASAGRVLAAFMASVLFLQTTLADDLMESLVARGANYRLAFVVLSAIQLVPRLQARAGAILDAQQARGLSLGGSVGHRIRSLVPLIGPVLLGSLIDVRERTFALEARAFGVTSRRTAYRVVADPPIDRALRWVMFGALVAVVAVGVFGMPRL